MQVKAWRTKQHFLRRTKIKKAIRKKVKTKRDSICHSVKEEKDIAIAKHVLNLPEFIGADSIALYASFKSEVDTHSLIAKALGMGKRVILPKVNVTDWRLMLYEIKNVKELAKGYMDIPEPCVAEDRLRNVDDVDIFIIPGVAFDESGNRLGYSSGLYDKLLGIVKQDAPIIALAYEEQIVEKIFSEPHDIKVHKIITEKRIIECK